MNTSKQVNVMIGLLFLLVLTFGLYFVWDQNVRSGAASERQVEDNAERGGKLFATNCRICHGPKGQASLENSNFPGAPLNLESFRAFTTQGDLNELRQRLTDTIRCGRVGTLMPPWSKVDKTGPLSNTQIDQLVTLITGSGDEGVSHNPEGVSQLGWEEALLLAEELDRLPAQGPLLVIREVLSTGDTTITLSDAHIGFSKDQFLRIEEEIIQVVSFPASSALAERISAGTTLLSLDSVADFQAGTVIAVDGEQMRINSIDLKEKTITVTRGLNGTGAGGHNDGATVQDPRNDITVIRGAFDTDAAEHPEDTQVHNGPFPPPDGPLTGEDETPPCGQNPPQAAAADAPGVPTPSAGQPNRPARSQALGVFLDPINGLIETATLDNRFTNNNFRIPLGASVTIRITNQGSAVHNLRIASPDGEWETADDFAAPPAGAPLAPGQTTDLSFSLAQSATLVFRCDFHPAQMWGQITIP